MTYASEFTGNPKIEANGFGVTDMKVAVGLGRKACYDTPAVYVGKGISFDYFSQEIGGPLSGFLSNSVEISHIGSREYP